MTVGHHTQDTGFALLYLHCCSYMAGQSSKHCLNFGSSSTRYWFHLIVETFCIDTCCISRSLLSDISGPEVGRPTLPRCQVITLKISPRNILDSHLWSEVTGLTGQDSPDHWTTYPSQQPEINIQANFDIWMWPQILSKVSPTASGRVLPNSNNSN